MKGKKDIKEQVEAELESLEVKPEEEAKGTRDLFLETLTKIGCQYEIDSEDGNILFAYQGEHFVATANNEGWYVEEGKTVDVHCKSTFPFISQMPDLEDYLRNELGNFFTAHHLVGSEMAKLREQEENAQAN